MSLIIPFIGDYNSIIVVDDLSNYQQEYLYRITSYTDYCNRPKQHIGLYRKQSKYKKVCIATIEFDAEFKSKCINDPDYFLFAIMQTAKQDLKKYIRDNQFESIVNSNKPINSFKMNSVLFDNYHIVIGVCALISIIAYLI